MIVRRRAMAIDWNLNVTIVWRVMEKAALDNSGNAEGDPLSQPIALLINVLSNGGAQRRIAALANRFSALGRTVHVVSFETAGPMLAMLSPAIQTVTLKQSRLPGFLATMTHVREIRGYLVRAKPAVMMSCVTDTHLAAAIANRRVANRTRLVLRSNRNPIQSVPAWNIGQRIMQPIKLRKACWYYRRADAVIALSADCAKVVGILVGHYPVRIDTILNPVLDDAWIAQTMVSLPRSQPKPVPLVLGVGRLTKQKDFATLLRAFALLRAIRPARLVLLGEGVERRRLEKLASRLGIASDVEMPGDVSDVAAWMRRADLVVSSSRWEGLQATLIEALASGCPVVATDCPGGARETLEDGRLGRLVPVGKPDAMARAMKEELDRSPDPQMLVTSTARFTAKGKAEHYLAVFDSLANYQELPEYHPRHGLAKN